MQSPHNGVQNLFTTAEETCWPLLNAHPGAPQVGQAAGS